MAVHVFPVESLSGNEQHLSMEQAYSKVLKYLATRNQLGETTNKYMQCPNMAAVRAAIDEFVDWSGKHPQDDPKLLWMRLHGCSPAKDRPRDVGTRGYSAGTHFNWWQVFSGATGKLPLNSVVVMDVCWGASPAAPAMMSGRTGNPTRLFGSVRAAYPFELEAAVGLIVGALARGVVPTVLEAKGMVRALNKVFPADSKNNKPFYRVCWWNKRGEHRFPDAPEHNVTRVRV
jgi:hypothetical protein